jgi:hypothetical protein
MRWARYVACMREMRNAYKILVRKTDGKRPARRPRRKWKDNIKLYLKEIGCEMRNGFNWLSSEIYL